MYSTYKITIWDTSTTYYSLDLSSGVPIHPHLEPPCNTPVLWRALTLRLVLAFQLLLARTSVDGKQIVAMSLVRQL
jgi:hypothetical protein